MQTERRVTKDGRTTIRHRVYYIDTDGERKVKSFKTKREAANFKDGVAALNTLRDKAKDMNLDIKEALRLKDTLLPEGHSEALDSNIKYIKAEKVVDVVNSFLDASANGTSGRAEVAPNTLRFYKHKLGFFSEAFGDTDIRDVSRRQLQDFLDSLITSGKSRKTVMAVLVSLRTLYSWASSTIEITTNPTIGCKVAQTARDRDMTIDEAEVYSDDDVALIMKALVGDDFTTIRDRAAISLGFFAGLRIGEVLGLEWRHINFEKHSVTVAQSAHDRTGAIQRTKTVRSRRVVSMNKRLEADLKALYDLSEPNPEDRVIVTDSGKPVIQRNLLRSLQSAQKRAKLATIRTFHEARHYYVSKLIEAGFNIKRIAALIGHADETLTLRVYGHLLNTSEDREKDFEELSAVFE